MKIKSQKDFWSGLMFVVIGIAFAWGATSYSFGIVGTARPGLLPVRAGRSDGAARRIVLFKALTIETEDGEPIGAWAWKPLVFIVAAVAVFGWALPHLGMIIAMPLLVIGSAAGGRRIPVGRMP